MVVAAENGSAVVVFAAVVDPAAAAVDVSEEVPVAAALNVSPDVVADPAADDDDYVYVSAAVDVHVADMDVFFVAVGGLAAGLDVSSAAAKGDPAVVAHVADAVDAEALDVDVSAPVEDVPVAAASNVSAGDVTVPAAALDFPAAVNG